MWRKYFKELIEDDGIGDMALFTIDLGVRREKNRYRGARDITKEDVKKITSSSSSFTWKKNHGW